MACQYIYHIVLSARLNTILLNPGHEVAYLYLVFIDKYNNIIKTLFRIIGSGNKARKSIFEK